MKRRYADAFDSAPKGYIKTYNVPKGRAMRLKRPRYNKSTYPGYILGYRRTAAGKWQPYKDWTSAKKYFSSIKGTGRYYHEPQSAISYYGNDSDPLPFSSIRRFRALSSPANPGAYRTPPTSHHMQIVKTPVGRVLFSPGDKLKRFGNVFRAGGLVGAGLALGTALVGGGIAIRDSIKGILLKQI